MARVQLCNGGTSVQLCNGGTKVQLCELPAPCVCPCGDDSGETWGTFPCGGLVETYTITICEASYTATASVTNSCNWDLYIDEDNSGNICDGFLGRFGGVNLDTVNCRWRLTYGGTNDDGDWQVEEYKYTGNTPEGIYSDRNIILGTPPSCCGSGSVS